MKTRCGPVDQSGMIAALAQRKPGAAQIDWVSFAKSLEGKYRGGYDKAIFNKAMRYAPCLLSGDLGEVASLPKSVVPNVLCSLSALSKFLGLHDQFLKLTKTYGLKWASRSSADFLIDRMNRSDNPNDVWDWCRTAKECLPDLKEFIDLDAVTGLRFSEALNCYNLIIQLTKEGTLSTRYYNNATGFIEHFKFREVFIRGNKKAFFSFVPLELLEAISQKTPIPQRHTIQKLFRRRELPQRFSDVREANGTFLLSFLNQVEIDLLHGRIGTSVFLQHYANPKLIPDLRQRCAQAAKEILEKITVDSLMSTTKEGESNG